MFQNVNQCVNQIQFSYQLIDFRAPKNLLKTWTVSRVVREYVPRIPVFCSQPLLTDPLGAQSFFVLYVF